MTLFQCPGKIEPGMANYRRMKLTFRLSVYNQQLTNRINKIYFLDNRGALWIAEFGIDIAILLRIAVVLSRIACGKSPVDRSPSWNKRQYRHRA